MSDADKHDLEYLSIDLSYPVEGQCDYCNRHEPVINIDFEFQHDMAGYDLCRDCFFVFAGRLYCEDIRGILDEFGRQDWLGDPEMRNYVI